MKHGSLFSGIGGFDLAAEWMGWENVFHCEWNEFGKKILKYYWPKAISYDDITKTDFTIHRGRIDILTGGFPCQPYSTAGKRLGKEDDRHLWPEMLRAIREIQPSWIVGENVYGLLNWNGGLVFNEVQTDLENEGYEVQPYLLPAAGVGAPHQRYRIWFVANSINDGNMRGSGTNEKKSREESIQERNKVQRATEPTNSRIIANPDNSGHKEQPREKREKKSLSKECRKEGHARVSNGAIRDDGNDSNTNNDRLQRRPLKSESKEKCKSFKEQFTGCSKFFRQDWEEFPTQSPIYNGNDGIPRELDGITVSKWRRESVKAGGNAIVPQVAHQIFKAIEQYEKIIV